MGADSGLSCGAGQVVVTPALGSPIPGGRRDRVSSGVRDELFARCVCVEAAASFAWVSVDAVDLPRSLVERVRADVAARVAIPAGQVMVTATHAHTAGPTVETSFVRAVDEDYLAWLAGRIADLVVMAFERREPARIGAGSGQLSGVAFNRRFHMRGGGVRTNPGVGNADILRPAGPVDSSVAVVRIDAVDGRPLATITNFGCHADTVGGDRYSGDFPGVLDRTVKQVLGPEVVGLFAQGPSGDINHVNVDDPEARRRPHTERIGRCLAAETLKVRELVDVGEASVALEQAPTPVRCRTISAEQADAARAALRPGSAASDAERALAPQVLELAEQPAAALVAEVAAIRLTSSAAAVFLPGELFTEFGLAIKDRSPFAITIVNELSNASAGGYICTRAAFAEGGYEPMTRRYSRLAEEAGDQLVDNAVEALQQLHKAR